MLNALSQEEAKEQETPAAADNQIITDMKSISTATTNNSLCIKNCNCRGRK